MFTREKIIEQFEKVHSNLYDYSKVIYINNSTKVEITCKKHGVFLQTPNSHKNGRGCPKCGIESRYLKQTKKQSAFIKDAKKAHNNFYSYNQTEYKNTKSKIKITCPNHGSFLQKANDHLNGHGCPKCKNKKNSDKFSDNLNEVLIKFEKAHGNIYDYSKVDYKSSKIKVEIICKKHGSFWQTPNNHVNGANCPSCSGNLRYTTKSFIEKVDSIHKSKYDYTLTTYKNNQSKIIISCPEHGEFNKTAAQHLKGEGCQKCGRKRQAEYRAIDLKTILNRFRKTHGDKYDYSQSNYKGSDTPIEIVCREHGSFFMRCYDHKIGYGCKKCSGTVSKEENNIKEWIEETFKIEVKAGDRKILNGKELDIYIPSKKLAIEYNGIYWHSEIFKERDYHENKYINCKRQGIQLLHVFEDDWLENENKIKDFLRHKLGGVDNKIGARETTLKEINSKTAREFYNKNHLQGKAQASISLGLFKGDTLMAAISFLKRGSNNDYNLTRFCSKRNYIVRGGFSKLLKYFLKNNKPSSIITFSDNNYSDGELYLKNGFKKVYNILPDYKYIINNKRYHKFGFRKDKLKKMFPNSTGTEKEIAYENNLYRIYDSGKQKFELKV